MMRDSTRLLPWICLLTLFVFACTLGEPKPDALATLDPLYTAAAKTLEAMEQQGTTAPAGAGASMTPSLSWGLTPTYAAPARVDLCNAAAFIQDVTFPDGSRLDAGTTFTKTWRIKNVGTCSWSTSYALAFVSGDRMSGGPSVNLPGTVRPGETVDLSVKLTAPSKGGAYRGYWKLRNSSGVLFGIGPQADTAFWADIRVTGPEYVAYDFAALACDADWKNNNGSLPCPGVEGDDRGYVLILSDPRMEDGRKESQSGLLTTPKHTPNGTIQGKYPAITVQAGDRFLAWINCQYKANTCDVIFRLEARLSNGQVKSLGQWHEVNEGQYYPVNLDLSALAGDKVRFFLTVHANDSKGKDQALWLAPRIVRQGAAPANPTATRTATPSPTPTATQTATGTATHTATATFTDTPTTTP